MGLLERGSEKAKTVEDAAANCRREIEHGIHVTITQCEEVLTSIVRVTRDTYRCSFT